MKPTQEQIEAALSFMDEDSTDEQYLLVRDYIEGDSVFCNVAEILAAAYRDAMAEIERLQGNLSASNFVAAIPPHEIICTRCGLREERGEKPSCDF
jgi:hypothetical protein